MPAVEPSAPLDFDLGPTPPPEPAITDGAGPLGSTAAPDLDRFRSAVLQRMVAERAAMANPRRERQPIPLRFGPPEGNPLPVPTPSPGATAPVTVISALISFGLQAMFLQDWKLSLGITVLIFVHECGHAVAARRCRRPYRGMVFFPFVGAAVRLGGRSSGPAEDAAIGIMGPLLGGLAGVGLLAAFFATRIPYLARLAMMAFGMNAINLAPLRPLDGTWITPVLQKTTPGIGRTSVEPATRQRFLAAYIGLIAFLAIAFMVATLFGG